MHKERVSEKECQHEQKRGHSGTQHVREEKQRVGSAVRGGISEEGKRDLGKKRDPGVDPEKNKGVCKASHANGTHSRTDRKKGRNDGKKTRDKGEYASQKKALRKERRKKGGQNALDCRKKSDREREKQNLL